jgi:hypothetical protein
LAIQQTTTQTGGTWRNALYFDPSLNATFGNSVTATGYNISGASNDLLTADGSHIAQSLFAKIASPAFTGTPTAPTATVGTNTTQIATTAFVQAGFLDLSTYQTITNTKRMQFAWAFQPNASKYTGTAGTDLSIQQYNNNFAIINPTNSSNYALSIATTNFTADRIATFPDVTGNVVVSPNSSISILASTQITLVAGTKALSITGVTTGSHAYVTAVSQSGTVTTTFEYAAVCTSGTVTITALTNGGVTNTSDTSVLNVFVTN